MTARFGQDQLYREAAAAHGAALQRLAGATEANAERRRDLLQDMHVALWRSFAGFDGRCALRTWVYRVAHNVAASHVNRERSAHKRTAALADIEHLADGQDIAGALERTDAIARLNRLIAKLKTPDRQVLMLYLEDLDAAAIAEITGLSPGAVATRISRLKAQLAQAFKEFDHD
jgi:RNA polymerase sigma-70 factor (ECF subfamily)